MIIRQIEGIARRLPPQKAVKRLSNASRRHRYIFKSLEAKPEFLNRGLIEPGFSRIPTGDLMIRPEPEHPYLAIPPPASNSTAL